MDAKGTIAALGKRSEQDRLFIRVDRVISRKFPYHKGEDIPVTLIIGHAKYTKAHIKATDGITYPCWISNPRLKNGEDRLGQFLIANGYKMNDKVTLELNYASGMPVIYLKKDGARDSLASSEILPNEISDAENIFEGAKKRITVNAYERDRRARQRCIDHWGCQCNVCGADFFRIYGELGRDYIHVHHLTPLSDIGKEYRLDPIKDLRPVCPNCHAMIHRGPSVLTIEELMSVIHSVRNDIIL